MNITAIYPGTFDPITHGHADIAIRASKLFDRVFFAVAASVHVESLFSTQERIVLAENVFQSHQDIEICSFEHLVTDMARELGSRVIIRGIRAAADFDYEFQMAGMNRSLYAEAETVFLRPAEHLSFISSTLVKEIASLGGDVSQFVEQDVIQALKEKFHSGVV